MMMVMTMVMTMITMMVDLSCVFKRIESISPFTGRGGAHASLSLSRHWIGLLRKEGGGQRGMT